MPKFILASSSPRRQALLKLLDFEFRVISPTVEENLDASKTLEEAIMDLAYQKAEEVFKNNTDATVLGFDTLVCLGDHVLGKPNNEKDVYEMLKILSNQTHRVITGCAIISKDLKKVFYKDALVTFSKISDDEIEAYIQTKEPYGKAGAYAIQGYGAKFIENIHGDYYAVMGLPVHEVYKQLKGLTKN
ncbi:Maf family protein [Liberiplasma polymorphum]|jgi:septum formation protein|uniref:Maf family protein n=1 Tax=Liberiplasma polymorphum TaxID=3374570 RepID=UPI003770A8AB